MECTLIDMKTKYWLIILVIATISSFLLGRLSINEKESVKEKKVVKYIPSSPVRDTIYKPTPYLVEIPSGTDTIKVVEFQKIDTAEVLKDYLLRRFYSLDFSNDTIGTFKVNAIIERNSLVSADSYIRPLVKTVLKENTITKYNVKPFQIFGVLGTSPKLDLQKVTFGIDLNQKYLLGVSGLRWHDNYNYTIDLGIKF